MPTGSSRRVPCRPTGRFPAAHRIRKRPEFVRVQTTGQRVATSHFLLLIYAADLASGIRRRARLGITVSRKVGTAAVRNRAKRLVREAFRATRALWQDDVDVVVIVRKPTGTMKLHDVVAEWCRQERPVCRRTEEARIDREKRESALAQSG